MATLAAHGHPRYTGDIDFRVNPTPENADLLLAVLGRFGFGGLGLTAADFRKPESVVQLGYPPARIALLTAIDGVSFADCYPRRQAFEVDGVTLQLIDVDDLKANKRAAARPKDLADLDALGALRDDE